MTLKDTLKTDMKEAMKAKDIVTRDTIRFLNSAIKQVEVDERRDVGDDEIIKIIQKSIKQRNEAADQYKEANRDDLVEKELSQAEVLQRYLPVQLSDEELKSEISKVIDEVGATSMKDMGKIMGVASKRLSGKADGKRINECVKNILG
jgi:uncharacterized protein YqeY